MQDQISLWWANISMVAGAIGVIWPIWTKYQDYSQKKHLRQIEILQNKKKAISEQCEQPIKLQLYIGEQLFMFLFLIMMLGFLFFAGLAANKGYTLQEERFFIFAVLGLEIAIIFMMTSMVAVNALERLRELKEPAKALSKLEKLIEIEKHRHDLLNS